MILTTDCSSATNTKKRKRGEQTLEEKVANIEAYVEHGNARGRSASAATVYQGKAGYFFISSREIYGKKRDVVFFSHGDGDVTVTDLNAIKPKAKLEGPLAFDQAKAC